MNGIIRVVLVATHYPPTYSGPSRQAHSVNKHLLHDEDIDLKVITMNHNGEPDIYQGVRVGRIPKKGMKKNYENTIGTVIWSLFVMIELFKRRKEIDLVHIPDSYFYTGLINIFTFFIRKPLLLKNPSANGPIKNRTIAQKIRLSLIKFRSHIVGISSETYNELINTGFNKKRIHFIPNGVDTIRFSPVDINKKIITREIIGLNKDEFIVTYVGLLNKRKRVDAILHAWKEVRTQINKPRLLLVGPAKDKKFHQWVLDFIKDNNLEDDISLLGQVDDVKDLLTISDLFLFPSEREGLPNALMEAMSTGLPCIAQPIEGVTDLITHNKNGLLCNKTNDLKDEIVKYLLKLADNEKWRNELGEKARQTMVNKYDIKKIAMEYKSIYKKISL